MIGTPKRTTGWLATWVLLAWLGPETGMAAPPAGGVFPAEHWETRTPEQLGLDADRLRQFADNVGGAGCLIKDGFLAISWGDQAQKRDWASAAKPVLSTLLMFAVSEGKLDSADAPVQQAGWSLQAKDQSMTFRHLANMVSGYACGERPGEAWGYNDLAIQLYALSLQQVFGQSLDEAAQQRLAPLQFEDGSLFSSRGGLGVSTTPRDFARIAWLWLNRGDWKGRPLIPEALFRQCAQVGVPADLPRTKTKGEDYLNIGSYGGGTNQTAYGPGVYGFNWWFNGLVGESGNRVWPAAPPDTYQANGMWNRDVVTVFPSLNMVVAFCGGNLGKFEPGETSGQANKNLQLLVEGVRTSRP